jgi:DNA polymerase-3 subunit gamma/tau
MSLYIKYRPKELEEVVGNIPTVNAIRNTIEKKEHPHTFLFIGPSGCGKTTLSRILASKLGCSIADTNELNAANFRGIETAREIIQQMKLAPIAGKTKSWIIDEAHQLTKDGQSALLKALEDTPKHVYFFLATTDPQKLLPTIKNRCTTFNVSLLSEDRIETLLENILKEENKKIPKKIIEHISQSCSGSPRMAIVMLEKVIGLPEKRMLKVVSQIADNEKTTIDLCRALINFSKWEVVCKILKSLSEQEPETIRLSVLGYCKTIMLDIKSTNKDKAFLVMDSFKEPFYNTGHAGLVRACYEALMEGGE